MYTNNNYISPYLRRPPRSQPTVMRRKTTRNQKETRHNAATGIANGSPNRKDAGDVELSR